MVTMLEEERRRVIVGEVESDVMVKGGE